MWQAMRKRIGARDGFTLIELVVVVAILGLLAWIVTPKVMGAISNARVNGFKSSAKQVQVGLERLYAEKGAYPTGVSMCGSAWTTSATACPKASLVSALETYVNLDAGIVKSATYTQPATAGAAYELTIVFQDGDNEKTATITPGNVTLN